MKVDHNKIQLGSDPDPTKNFIIQTPPVQDGTLEIRRGTLDAPGALVAKFNEHGLVDPRVMVDVTTARSFGQTYSNDTGGSLIVYVSGANTAANGGIVGYINSGVVGVNVHFSPTGTCALSFEVPDGSDYSVTATPGFNKTQWREYRLPEGA